MIFSMTTAGAAQKVSARMQAAAQQVDVRTGQVVRHFSHLLKTRIQAKASGRPGPNAPTGNYRRSWNVQFRKEGQTHVGEISTNAPQGRRLEYGFHGVDSLGREFNQPAYPHVGVARDEIKSPFEKAAEQIGRLL